MRFSRLCASATVLSVVLAGCGSDPRAEGKPNIAFLIPNTGSNFAIEMGMGFRAGAQGVDGVEFSVTGPPIVDGPKQLAMFESIVDEVIDGVSVATLSPELFARPLSVAAKEGLPLIAVDIQPLPASGVRLFIGNDNYELGQLLADEAIKKIPADASGTVVLGTSSPGVPALDYRGQGMRDRFVEQRPNIEVTGPFDTAQDVPANKAAWQRLVTANPKALAFLGTGDADGYNLAAIRKAERADWLAGAFDLDPRSLAAVKAGQLVALISPEHFLKGAAAGRIQAEHARSGDALPVGWLYIPGLAVTTATVDDVILRQASETERLNRSTAELEKAISSAGSGLRPMGEAR